MMKFSQKNFYLHKTILNDPETYFTEDIMKQLDDAAAKEFKYARSD